MLVSLNSSLFADAVRWRLSDEYQLTIELCLFFQRIFFEFGQIVVYNFLDNFFCFTPHDCFTVANKKQRFTPLFKPTTLKTIIIVFRNT
jgi:hypothetical protein